jgi:hypothetical protein
MGIIVLIYVICPATSEKWRPECKDNKIKYQESINNMDKVIYQMIAKWLDTAYGIIERKA